MYHFFRQNPLVRPAAAFALGIFLFHYYPVNSILFIWITGLFLLLSLGTRLIFPRIHLFLPVLLCCCGYFAAERSHAVNKVPEKLWEKEQVFLALVEEEASEGYNYRCRVQLQQVYPMDSSPPCVLHTSVLWQTTDSLIMQLEPGDQVWLKGRISPLNGAAMPFAFDYAAYAKQLGVAARLECVPGQWTLRKEAQGFSIRRSSLRLKKFLLSTLKKHLSRESAGIAQALLLGDSEDLDENTRQAYSQTGTTHILSVSGMHIALFYILLEKILLFIRWQRLRHLLIFLILWFYALLTGLSPSVLRAVTMFSFVLLGKELNRQNSIYNTLAFTLLVLLIWDPLLLFRAGFLLSFLAVLGIILLTRPAEQLLPINRPWLQKISTLLVVSVAAQLFTSPLSLFYFHQFPTWFLLANLILVPLSTPVMYLCILMAVVSPFPSIAQLAALPLEYLIQLMNRLTSQMALLPFSTLSQIHVSAGQAGLLYIMLFTGIGFLVYRKTSWLWSCLLGFSVFLASTIKTEKARITARGIIVASVPGKSVLVVHEGRAWQYIGDSLMPDKRKKLLDAWRCHWQLSETGENTSTQQYLWGSSGRCADSNWIHLKKRVAFKRVLKVQWLILAGRTGLSWEQLRNQVDFCIIVLDSSHSRKSRQYWISRARKAGIPWHDCREKPFIRYQDGNHHI